jgi:hypothetical protein
MGAWDWTRNFVNNIPIVGGFTSSAFGDPKQEAKQDAFRQATAQINQARPEMMQSRLNAMSNTSAAFQPMNKMLQQTYGGFSDPKMQTQEGQMDPNSGMMDFNQLNQNPMTQGMQDQMYMAAFGRPAPPSRIPGAPPNGQPLPQLNTNFRRR